MASSSLDELVNQNITTTCNCIQQFTILRPLEGYVLQFNVQFRNYGSFGRKAIYTTMFLTHAHLLDSVEISGFHGTVGSLLEVLETQAKCIEKEKLKVPVYQESTFVHFSLCLLPLFPSSLCVCLFSLSTRVFPSLRLSLR